MEKKKIYRRTEKVEIRLRLGILDPISTKMDPEENKGAQSVNDECNNQPYNRSKEPGMI